MQVECRRLATGDDELSGLLASLINMRHMHATNPLLLLPSRETREAMAIDEGVRSTFRGILIGIALGVALWAPVGWVVSRFF